MFNIKKCLIFSLLPLMLLGCGGGSDDDGDGTSPSPQEKIAINAQDLLSFSPTKHTQVIDLRQKVTAEDNQDLIIENIESIDSNCAFNENDINGLTFKVTTDSADVCRFKYHVKPQSSKYAGTSEGMVQVVVTEDYTKGDFLPPVSRTVLEGNTIRFTPEDLLIETGYAIDPSSVYLTGETESGDIGYIIEPTGTDITYKAPTDTIGTVRIFYTEIDSVNNIAKPGVIYIAIGQNGNSSPIAKDKVFPTVNIISGPQPIDVADLISDAEGDDLQLIYVQAMSGGAVIDGHTSFTYTPTNPGSEAITYIVSDHNGGYGIGLLQFDVTVYENIIDTVQQVEFIAPLTLSDLSKNGVYTGLFQEDGMAGVPGLYPTFDKSLAEAYCKTMGAYLPTTRAMEDMRKNVLGNQPVFASKYHWHSGQKYATDGRDAFSLYDGSRSQVNPAYFSCARSIKDKPWAFVEKYYGGKFDNLATVYLSSDSGTGSQIFLPEDDYQLKYEIDNMNYEGRIITPEEASQYIDIQIRGNSVLVEKKIGHEDKVVSLILNISDPKATNTTQIIYGLTICPPGVDPIMADRLGCTTVVNGRNSEMFTLGFSNTILKSLAVPDYSTLGSKEIGKGYTRFRAIYWSKRGTEAARAVWLENITVACDVMNQLKIAGRSNWQVGSSTIQNKFDAKWFSIPDAQYPSTQNFVKWICYQDGKGDDKLGDYGQGYVNVDPNNKWYVNQNMDTKYFAPQDPDNSFSFPSCWSLN
ncbi:hypothetical protein [uncultured Photobacterium sp.]|uniref:Ig-like domain-containing protein n=1 Tax=uncultured Photobacterium sp. TaxID=173973 RepID=UPI00263383E9|nr:hypothetical protein [uncultured Photobacterium sp.]